MVTIKNMSRRKKNISENIEYVDTMGRSKIG